MIKEDSAQKSLVRYSHNIVFDSYCNLLYHIIKKFNIKVTRQTLRLDMSNFKSFPFLSLKELSLVFENYNVKNIPCKIDLETLKELQLPVIIYVSDQDKDGNPFNKFCSIEEISVNEVALFDGKVLQKFSLENFCDRWKGVTLYLDPEEHSGEALFIENEREAINAAETYKSSIRIIDDFFSSDECDFVINYCNSNNLFVPSKVYAGKNEHQLSPTRTSFSAFMQKKYDGTFEHLYDRIASLLDVPVNHIEPLQCVRYSGEQFFNAHFDANEELKRPKTVLIYLNDDFKGGETYFPEVDFKIIPKKGRALIFNNYNGQNEIDIHSLHEGMSVSMGTKYACNAWIRNSQFP